MKLKYKKVVAKEKKIIEVKYQEIIWKHGLRKLQPVPWIYKIPPLNILKPHKNEFSKN